jgi:thiol-disulfide isomerase/thioredoxin
MPDQIRSGACMRVARGVALPKGYLLAVLLARRIVRPVLAMALAIAPALAQPAAPATETRQGEPADAGTSDHIPPARWTSTPVRPFPKASDNALTAELASHRGKPVLVNFWASWCPPCREELPDLQRFAVAEKARGLVVLTVAVADQRKTVTDLLWELGVDLPVVFDPYQSISRAWGAFGLPTSVLLDRRHRIRYRAVGVVDWQAEPTREAVAKVMAATR